MAYRILRIKEVMNKTGFSRTTTYRLVADNEFPQPIHLGGRAVGWVESEIDAWIEHKMASRQSNNITASLASASM